MASTYDHQSIDQKWQQYWMHKGIFHADESSGKPKYYVLDMFPYPSGAGLHVGHPLGYIASDIVARVRRHQGYEVLHPMGYDAFGLPAEQYAIQTGQHPATTTAQNARRYKQQLKSIGLSFDWSREIFTSDPSFYKWTQWIFIQLFESWYDHNVKCARPLTELIDQLENEGNSRVHAAGGEQAPTIGAETWRKMDPVEKSRLLQHYRLAYLADAEVNWCPDLGTVLANDEVKDGYSERGGFPVYKKKMRQWFLRITAYAERLLQGLDRLDWPEPVKEVQRNWIGKSHGAEVHFYLDDPELKPLSVFTTRPDTLFGVTFMVMAPEHERAQAIASPEQQEAVARYIREAQAKTERDRLADTRTITGVFTGRYARHPFTDDLIPIWLSEYVLAGYGTGVIMAVPAHDSRDHAFARHFDLPIREVVSGGDPQREAYDAKEGRMVNSQFLNGMEVAEAIPAAIHEIQSRDLGAATINYRMRDAGFSRQRYWGEPFPIVYQNGIPVALPSDQLPVTLPEIESYKPTSEGQPPLARATEWTLQEDGSERETNTMPGYAGSSWYFLRFMDPYNPERFCSSKREAFWQHVDFYMGGAEHACGHLLYARFWQMFLYDRGWVSQPEPFQKLVNQGMILGRSSFIYRVVGRNKLVSHALKEQYPTQALHVDIHLVDDQDRLDVAAFRKRYPEFADADIITEDDGYYYCGHEIEKMSKARFNVVNPDDLVNRYGADTFRTYEMFLGPIEQSKPWNTNGIEGVSKFYRKVWLLFHSSQGEWLVNDAEPTPAEYKTLHKTIKKVTEDIENISFNTCVSALMVAVNELTAAACHKRSILEPLCILISPFGPHIAEELWEQLGRQPSIAQAPWPQHDEKYLLEDTFEYPVSVNGKLRTRAEFPLDMPKEQIAEQAKALPAVQKWLEGKSVQKIIVVPGRIINMVVK